MAIFINLIILNIFQIILQLLMVFPRNQIYAFN